MAKCHFPCEGKGSATSPGGSSGTLCGADGVSWSQGRCPAFDPEEYIRRRAPYRLMNDRIQPVAAVRGPRLEDAP